MVMVTAAEPPLVMAQPMEVMAQPMVMAAAQPMVMAQPMMAPPVTLARCRRRRLPWQVSLQLDKKSKLSELKASGQSPIVKK